MENLNTHNGIIAYFAGAYGYCQTSIPQAPAPPPRWLWNPASGCYRLSRVAGKPPGRLGKG